MSMMNRIIKSIVLIVAVVSLFSCKKDENSTVDTYVRPFGEQEPVDDAAIQEFLQNNYFNEEEFLNADNITDFNFDVKFYLNEVLADEDENGNDTLETNETVIGYDSNGDGVIDNNDVDNTTVFTRTALIDYVGAVINGITIETKTIEVGGVDHTLYILKIIEGQGDEQPKFCDNAFLSYTGLSLDKVTFDNALNPTWLDLSNTVQGFSESVSEFKTATNKIAVGDGTFIFENFGVGVAFMPSGLAYYSNSVGGSLPSYSPARFKLKIYESSEMDHDGDGIPTYVEDLNGNHNLKDDDTDGNGNPNYTDTNDDNDPVLTKDEAITTTYVINDGDAEPIFGLNEYEVNRVVNESVVPNEITITTSTYIDSDNDGILDYLDSDS